MWLEFISSVFFLLLFCLVLLGLDAAAGGLLTLLLGIPFKKAFCYGLWSLLLPVLLLAYGVLIERNCYRVKTVELGFDNLPAEFDGYRIAQLSDIHSRSFRHRLKSLQRAVNKVNAQNPDVLVFTGDLMTMTPDEVALTAPALQNLRAKDGVLAIIGNHDYGIYMDSASQARLSETPKEQLVARERAMGWQVLLNEHTFLHRGGDSIAVVGVENTSPSRHFPSTGNLALAEQGTEGLFRVLLTHDPMHWDSEVVGKDYPLTLSGHTHAAQFSLFGWSPSQWLFKQYRGLYEKNGQKLYVNVGLGETIVPLRIGAAPEITVIVLRKTSGASDK